MTAFLLLYGYWCGDGCLDTRSRLVVFSPKKKDDKPWVLGHLATLGLTVAAGQVSLYDCVNGQLAIYVRDERWSDYFCGEYGPKYAVAAVSSSRPHTHTGLIVPLPKSVNWSAQHPRSAAQHTLSIPVLLAITHSVVVYCLSFRFWEWVWRLRKERARHVLAGLRFVDGTEATDTNCIYTTRVDFRDEIVRLALHAGYSARFNLMYKKDDHRGYDNNGRAIIVEHDSWSVAYTDHQPAAQPVLRNQRDIGAVDLHSGRPVPVWCVTVPPHHLIIARRIRTNGKGVVTQASRPIVVGNCKERDASRMQQVRIPYGCKLLVQELQAMNIMTRIKAQAY